MAQIAAAAQAPLDRVLAMHGLSLVKAGPETTTAHLYHCQVVDLNAYTKQQMWDAAPIRGAAVCLKLFKAGSEASTCAANEIGAVRRIETLRLGKTVDCSQVARYYFAHLAKTASDRSYLLMRWYASDVRRWGRRADDAGHRYGQGSLYDYILAETHRLSHRSDLLASPSQMIRELVALHAGLIRTATQLVAQLDRLHRSSDQALLNDVKAQNVCVEGDEFAFIDVGGATFKDGHRPGTTGITADYTAPELHQQLRGAWAQVPPGQRLQGVPVEHTYEAQLFHFAASLIDLLTQALGAGGKMAGYVAVAQQCAIGQCKTRGG